MSWGQHAAECGNFGPLSEGGSWWRVKLLAGGGPGNSRRRMLMAPRAHRGGCYRYGQLHMDISWPLPSCDRPAHTYIAASVKRCQVSHCVPRMEGTELLALY